MDRETGNFLWSRDLRLEGNEIYDQTDELSGFVCGKCGRIIAPLGYQLFGWSDFVVPRCRCMKTEKPRRPV